MHENFEQYETRLKVNMQMADDFVNTAILAGFRPSARNLAQSRIVIGITILDANKTAVFPDVT